MCDHSLQENMLSVEGDSEFNLLLKLLKFNNSCGIDYTELHSPIIFYGCILSCFIYSTLFILSIYLFSAGCDASDR